MEISVFTVKKQLNMLEETNMSLWGIIINFTKFIKNKLVYGCIQFFRILK